MSPTDLLPDAALVAAPEEAAPGAVTARATDRLGMTQATGHPYRHVLEVLEDVTRPTGET